MCGIAGFVTKKSQTQTDPQILKKMLTAIAHRGPDGEGEFFEDHRASGGWSVALGHRRLAIIDIAGGAQPFTSQDGRFEITFNGEIFNFLDLKKDLEALGHSFKTRSDTEVLLAHFIQYGFEGLSKLNGMFAFAVWDKKESELWLARDRFGIKPFYYVPLKDGGIAFASELTALMEHPSVERILSLDSLRSYFFSDYIPAPETIFDGVFKLPPACAAVWKNGNLSQPLPYWKLSPGKAEVSADLPAELWSRLGTAVSRQLISDVPVGVFLSGGIDSSTVAALAQKQALQRGGESIQTFSIGFDDPDYDESPYALQVAGHLATRHHLERVTEGTILEKLDSILNVLDEPMGDPSILPTSVVSEVASKHVKVILGGDGGDELWAGYPTYRALEYAQKYSKLPKILRSKMIEPLVRALPVRPTYQSLEWKAKRFALRWDENPFRRHLRWMSNSDLPLLNSIFPSVGAGDEPFLLGEFLPQFHSVGSDKINALLALDFQTYMPGSVLTKVDRASMAFGLEVRPPFLDSDFVDWAFSLPSSVKLSGKVSKKILKDAARPYLPQRILNRSKKGFAIPLARWMKTALKPRMEKLLTDSPLWEIPGLNAVVLREGWKRHIAGKEDFSRPLWTLLVLDHWMKRTGQSGAKTRKMDGQSQLTTQVGSFNFQLP